MTTLKQRRHEYARMMRAGKPKKKPGPRKLRHGAKDGNEECIRDAEMRDAIKSIDDGLHRGGTKLRPDQGRGHYAALAEARAIAWAELRARWAAEDAQAAADQQAKTDIYAAAGIVRMAPGEIDRPASGDFSAKRSAYLAAVMTLPVADRFAEVKAVAAALDCGANVITVGDLTRARKRAKGD